MPVSVTRVESVSFMQLGEGPHWDVPSQSLFFVDIFGKAIHKYTPSTNQHNTATFEKNISLIEWDGLSNDIAKIETLVEVDTAGMKDYSINDGKCDPFGRLWFGTMGSEPKGSIYCFENGKTLKKYMEEVHISNGLTWSHDCRTFYYIDSGKKTVDQYDYDGQTGVISNRKPIFSLEKNGIDGIFDGMTIDADGNLWIAIFNGYSVIKIDPKTPETLLQTVKIPAQQVTSVAFGGANLDELYVTTAKFMIDNEGLNPPVHGALYKVTGLGVKGKPMTNFKL